MVCMRLFPLFNSILRTALDADGKKIVNLGSPTQDSDAATKKYVDDKQHTIVLDDTVTETSSNGVKSSGIWSWVKSLLPHWLTSDYAEPATVESVANKRDKDDLAVYEKVGVGDDWVWTSDDPDLLNALETNGIKPKRVDDDSVGYHFWYTPTSFGDWTTTGSPWDPSYGVDAHIVKFKYESPVLGRFDVTATATRAYKFNPVSPADSLAKVSQVNDKIGKYGGTIGYYTDNSSQIFKGLDLLKFVEDYTGNEKTLREILSGFVGKSSANNPIDELMFGRLSALGGLYAPAWYLFSSGQGTLPEYLDSLAWRTTGNRTLSDYGIADGATKASLAPEYSATSVYSVGAFVYHDGSIYQCKTAIAEGGEAWNAEHWELKRLDDFFTESDGLKKLKNALLESAIGTMTKTDAEGSEDAADATNAVTLNDNSPMTVTIATETADALAVTFADARQTGGLRICELYILNGTASTDITFDAAVQFVGTGDSFPACDEGINYFVFAEISANKWKVTRETLKTITTPVAAA